MRRDLYNTTVGYAVCPNRQVSGFSMSDFTSAIKLEDVSLGFRPKQLRWRSRPRMVLDRLNLNVRTGETLGIIGRNGAGKSTLLKVLAGILSPNSGKVVRNSGQAILLTYQLGFNGNLTGRQNAIYSSLLQGMSRERIEAVMPEIIAFSGLGKAIDEPLETYSAGMKARLGFAVTAQSQADVILIDEALGVGDHSFREKSTRFMREWIRSNKTVVFVSHDENAVRNLCDRVAWLEQGAIVAEGSPHEIIRLYHDFDNLTKGVSEALNIPEEEVRSHPVNKNPVAQVERARREIKQMWDQEDDPQGLGNARVVKYCRPHKGVRLSHVAAEECGTWAWVESTKLMCRGKQSTVAGLYDHYERTVARLADQAKVDPYQFRRSSAHAMLLAMMEKVARIDDWSSKGPSL